MQVDDVGEFEGSEPAMLIELEVVLDDHEEADEKVGGSETSEGDQSLLANGNPWRVADTKEDGLLTVSHKADEAGCEDLRAHPSSSWGPWGEEQWRKTL